MRIKPSVSRRFNASRMGDLLMPSCVERNSSVRRESSFSRPSRMYSLMLLYARVVRLLGIFNFFMALPLLFQILERNALNLFGQQGQAPDPRRRHEGGNEKHGRIGELVDEEAGKQ